MKNLGYLLLMFLFINPFFACNNSIEHQFSNPLPEQQNKFSDGNICKIYTLGYNRNSKDLKPYFYKKNATYKLTALSVAASLQDSSLINDINQCLYDDDDKVRIAASFALGQLATEISAKFIREVLDFESTIDVKAAMISDLGKCGNQIDLEFITSMEIPSNQLLLIEGQATALVYFSIRNIHSAKATRLAINQLDADIPIELKDIYAQYFSRLKADYLPEFLLPLKNTYRGASTEAKMHIIKAFGSIINETSLRFLKQEIEGENDYRIKVNALSSLSNFDYHQIKNTLFEIIENASVNEAIKASEILLQKNSKKDVSDYFSLAQKIINPRVSGNLIRVAMEASADKKQFANVVIDLLESQQSVYHKAFYIKALSSAILEYEFVSNELFNTKSDVLRTAAMETIINMRKYIDFDSTHLAQLELGNNSLKEAFSKIFKKAIQSEDAALVSMTASIIADTSLGLINEFPNTFFLQQAIEDCDMPKDIEAYLSLVNALDANNINHPTLVFENSYALLDWNFIRKIPKNQKMHIKTSKGDITIELCVEDAPATAAYFLKQSLKNNYKSTFIHRAVPNFVVQSGDYIRGDGWGTAENMIRSEFSNLSYAEGTLGIASAGKDTESTQWFITLSSMPHLNGRYTIFAKVSNGMDIVHKLEVGDEILNIELL